MTYFAHPTAVIDKECTIGDDTKVWHFSHLMEGCRLGRGCNIGQNVVISPNVSLGDNVKVQNNVSLYTGLSCDKNVFIGPSAVFTNILNPRSEINRRNEYISTTVREGATIGANATILCGTTIGKYAFIGAGAVVTKDVPDYALVIGNPARESGWMSAEGYKLEFDAMGIAICPSNGEKYTLNDNRVKREEK